MLRHFFTALLSCLLGAASLLSPGMANAQASSVGQWTLLQHFPVIPIHHHLLPNGKVMMFGRPGNQPYLWDPATQAVTATPVAGYDLFCAGHAFLADGRLLVAGGHVVDFVGLANASVYDPATNAWTKAPDMNAGRWYPTVTTLPNGDALVTSGSIDTTLGIDPLPQVYQPATNTWRNLTSALLSLPMYPMNFVAPNGKIVMVGPSDYTHWLDTAGTGTWSLLGLSKFGFRDAGSAVMYADGKVLLIGGGSDPPKSTVELLDLNVPTPAWRTVASMSVARRHHNSTVLPDGTVLVTGGTSGPGYDDAASAIFAAEAWNPATETWTTLASASVPRLYHSSALLLPDGRVLTGGGDGYPQAEVFSPPYLFKGTRPAMSGVPASIGYGQRFTVQSADAASIQKVTLIRLSSVTHGFNENQRLNVLQFAPSSSGTLDITAPANANLAPPGHYMLFIVNGTGVPSLAAVVQLGASAPPPPAPPVLGSLSPSSAAAGGAAFTLTANGSNFVSGAAVRWNGAARTTTYVSSTQLSAAIAAADIAAAGTAQVSVLNPGGSASGTLPFTIAAAPVAPTLGSLSPSSATAGGAAFTLTANGSNFVSGAVVRWNGAARTTTYLSSTQLTAAIAAADIAAAGTAQVSVLNPGGSASGALPFTIAAAPVVPTLGSLSPSSATAGGAAFTLTANGSNFVSGASVLWNGAARTTTYVSGGQLSAAIAAADIAAAGTAQVSVLNPGGSASGALPFTVAVAPPSTFTLTVARAGTAPTMGTITSNPGGISCGSVCSAAFAINGTVTLTINLSNRKALFAGWGGACTGTAPTCTVTMNANRTVTATINHW